MGLAVVGKAFRNEIAPRNVLIRMREFSQAELQIFFDPDTINQHPDFKSVAKYKLRMFPVKNRKTKAKNIDELTCQDVVKKLKLPKFYVYHMARVQQFYLNLLKMPKARFRFKQLSDEEKAFYNKYHWDVEMDTSSFGWVEIGGVHYRTDHDLKGHQEVSKEKMEVNVDGKNILPHVLELSFGVDRNVYALLEMAYDQEKGVRDVLRFPRLVSPFDATIFPLINKNGLPKKAKELQQQLMDNGFTVFYDSSGSIGRRYRRVDEIGVAASFTIDHQTLKDNTVTIRDRDSMKQVRIKIVDVPQTLNRFLHGENLEKLGKLVKNK
jgi:glycyl-tRNA synthetase